MVRLTRLSDKLKIFFQKPEYVFVCLVSIFGIIMIFLMPFFMVADEGTHFYRAYQISNGGLISQSNKQVTGGMIPKEIKSYIEDDFYKNVRRNHQSPSLPYYKYFTQKINVHNQTLVDFRSAAIYSPIAYIPQVVGIKLAQIIYPSIGFMMVLARLANLVVYILLVGLAIRIAKKGKWVYVVLGLFPIAVQQAASLSSDVMTMGIVFVWVAFIGNMYFQRERISKKQWLIALLLAVGLALTKQTNIVLLMPLIFLPSIIFNNAWHKLRFVASVLGLGIIALFSWFVVMRLNNYNLQITGDTTVNQAGQISFLLQNPLHFISILGHTYFSSVILSDFYITSMHSVFSWLSYRLPMIFVALGYAGLLMSFMYDDDMRSPKLSNKFLTRLAFVQASTFILSLVAIAGTLYIAWTPVGSYEVGGIQGRYFLPFVPLLIPLFIMVKNKIKITTNKPYTIGVIVFTISTINLIAMLAVTYKWFY